MRQVFAKRRTHDRPRHTRQLRPAARYSARCSHPYSPLVQDPLHILTGPASNHLFGTDYLGRDNLSRLLDGTRATLLGALEVVGIAAVLGIWPGVLSAFVGRTIEFTLLRLVDLDHDHSIHR